ncbi:MAG: hypothetical protein V3S33_06795, partial [Gammaproteobacteria bacterium]
MVADAKDHVLCVLVEGKRQDELCEVARSIHSACALNAEIVFIDSTGSLSEQTPPKGSAVLATAGTNTQHTNPVLTALSSVAMQRPGKDVLLLNQRVRLPFGFDRRLKFVAYADDNIASVSPLSNTDEIFNVLLPDVVDTGLDVATLDRLVFNLSDRTYYEVPRFFSDCTYIRANALTEIRGAQDIQGSTISAVADQIGRAFRLSGYLNVLCDHLYVCAEALPVTGPAKEKSEDEAAFDAKHPITR